MINLLVIFSMIGVVNSVILVIYFFTTSKGKKTQNILFAFLILALTIRISKSILFFIFGNTVYNLVLVLGLAGFLLVGPLMWQFTKSVIDKSYRFSKTDLIHFIPAVVFILIFNFISYTGLEYFSRNFVYLSILVQYITYMVIVADKVRRIDTSLTHIIKQLNFIVTVLLLIWFTYFLNAITGYFHYLSGALIYAGIVYFSLILVINKGEIINLKPILKYEKTKISDKENNRLKLELEHLMDQEQIFTDSLLSLTGLAKQLRVSTNILSQVINVNYHKSFFEFLSFYRIKLAMTYLSDLTRKDNISEIAYDVGFNSLSAFNTAFKKLNGCTPSQYRKRLSNGE